MEMRLAAIFHGDNHHLLPETHPMSRRQRLMQVHSLLILLKHERKVCVQIFSLTPRNSQLTLYYDKELLRQINLIKNYPNVHKNYKAIVDRLSGTLNKAPRTQTPDDYFYVAKDSFSVGTLASIIEVYMPPHTGNQSSRLFHLPNVDRDIIHRFFSGNPGDSRQKNRKIRQAFAKGRDADILLAITRNQ